MHYRSGHVYGKVASDALVYIYDPFGRRINKTVSDGTTTTTTWFAWQGSRLIAEFDGSGNRTKRYAYLPGEYAPIQVQDANGVYTVHSDHLQTPRFLTNSGQQVAWRASYEAFGKAVINEDVDGYLQAVSFNVRYPGQYLDQESGLYYNYFRDYDPSIGRYIESDPIGLDGGLNFYAYVGNNPLSRFDFLGLCTSCNECFKIFDKTIEQSLDFYLNEISTTCNFNLRRATCQAAIIAMQETMEQFAENNRDTCLADCSSTCIHNACN